MHISVFYDEYTRRYDICFFIQIVIVQGIKQALTFAIASLANVSVRKISRGTTVSNATWDTLATQNAKVGVISKNDMITHEYLFSITFEGTRVYLNSNQW